MALKDKRLSSLFLAVIVSAVGVTLWLQTELLISCRRNRCLKNPESWKFYIGCWKFLQAPKQAPFLRTIAKPTQDRSNWMSRFQERRLKDLVLPGSHHTGVNRKHGRLFEDWDIPQVLSVSEQLKIGIRFLDLRVSTGPNLNEPSVTHNYNYLYLSDVILDTIKFLKGNPTETVVMNIMGGKNDSLYYFFKFNWILDWDKADRVLSDHQHYIYQGNNPLNNTIRELRGKIIIGVKPSLMSKFCFVYCLGSYYFTKSDSAPSLIPKMSQWLSTRPTDVFSYIEAVVTPSVTDVIDVLNPFSCRRKGRHKLYTFKSLQEISENANWYIYQWIKRKDLKGKVNGVITDFIHPRIVQAIIDKN